MLRSLFELAVFAGLAAATFAVHAQGGDTMRGDAVFKSECAECHSVRPDKNKKGPTLFAIVGRRSAQVSDFKYSDAMRATGWTWEAATLGKYIADPRRAVPGGNMKYQGLGDAKASEDLIAYLGTLR